VAELGGAGWLDADHPLTQVDNAIIKCRVESHDRDPATAIPSIGSALAWFVLTLTGTAHPAPVGGLPVPRNMLESQRISFQSLHEYAEPNGKIDPAQNSCSPRAAAASPSGGGNENSSLKIPREIAKREF